MDQMSGYSLLSLLFYFNWAFIKKKQQTLPNSLCPSFKVDFAIIDDKSSVAELKQCLTSKIMLPTLFKLALKTTESWGNGSI